MFEDIEKNVEDQIARSRFQANLNNNPKEQQQGSPCRICLQQLDQVQIIDCCRCKGSNSYIHQQCLVQWIKKSKHYKDSFFTYYHICDICRCRIFLQTTIKLRCITSEQIKSELLDKNICCTVTTIIFLFISFLVLGVIAYISTFTENKIETIVVAIGMTISLMIIVISLLIYTFGYVVKNEVNIVGIQHERYQGKNGTKKKNSILGNARNFLFANKIHNSHLQIQLDMTTHHILN